MFHVRSTRVQEEASSAELKNCAIPACRKDRLIDCVYLQKLRAVCGESTGPSEAQLQPAGHGRGLARTELKSGPQLPRHGDDDYSFYHYPYHDYG